MPEPVTSGIVAATVARLTSVALSGLSKRLSNSIANMTTEAADQLAIIFGKGFSEYLVTSYNKCRTFKSILNPSEPLQVRDHYVHVTLTCGNKKLDDNDLINMLSNLGCIIVTGLAGCGKSMFMRYLTLWSFDNPGGKIPLFVELRRLNNITNTTKNLTNRTLLTFIRNECTSRMSVISEHQFDIGLKSGAFLLILDGFDELNHEIRETLEQQILSIRKDFPATNLVISSRPDDRFSGWSEFHVYRVDQLTKEQATKLVESLPYDADVKKRFVREVRDRLYESHTSFLSSPLLATIMLLTFEGFAEIPDKMHSFYSKAFDTLFQKHDAQKEQFQRQTHTGLSLEDFKSCFSAFCAMSYLQERYSFNQVSLSETADGAIRYLEQSKGPKAASVASKRRGGVSERKVKPGELIDDLLQSVCMLQPDGLEISFVHRSFQEYFAAFFVTGLHVDKMPKILDRFCLRIYDSVMPMLLDMHREPVEQGWVLPTLSRLEAVLAEIDAPSGGPVAVLKHFMKEIGLGAGYLHRSMSELSAAAFIDVGSNFNRQLYGQLEMIGHLYPQYRIPGVLFGGPVLCEELKRRLVKKKFSTLEGFQEIRKGLAAFAAEANRNKISDGRLHLDKVNRYILNIRPLTPNDGWWLNELGFPERIRQLRSSLQAIRADVESRARERDSILSAFV